MSAAAQRLRQWEDELARLQDLLRDFNGSPEGRDNLCADIAECIRRIADYKRILIEHGGDPF
jgi:hypothetical protein